MSVAVFEAKTIGAGASGRNAGFVIPHFPGAMTPEFVEGILVINAFVGSLELAYQKDEGASSVTFNGVPNTEYVVESSSNLHSWLSLATVQTDGDGFGVYTFVLDRDQFETLFLRVVPRENGG